MWFGQLHIFCYTVCGQQEQHSPAVWWCPKWSCASHVWCCLCHTVSDTQSRDVSWAAQWQYYRLIIKNTTTRKSLNGKSQQLLPANNIKATNEHFCASDNVLLGFTTPYTAAHVLNSARVLAAFVFYCQNKGNQSHWPMMTKLITMEQIWIQRNNSGKFSLNSWKSNVINFTGCKSFVYLFWDTVLRHSDYL